MDPLTAAIIVAAISSGTSMYMNSQAEEAQKKAQNDANKKAAFSQELETKRTQQIQSNAASNSRRRSALVKNPNASAGAAGNVQVAGTQGLTTSNGGVNPQAGSAGTF